MGCVSVYEFTICTKLRSLDSVDTCSIFSRLALPRLAAIQLTGTSHARAHELSAPVCCCALRVERLRALFQQQATAV